MSFFAALLTEPFLQRALVAGCLASIACGVIGSYVVARRIGYLAGGISHSVLGGMGIAVYFGFDPVAGALVAALVSAAVIGVVNLSWRQHEDTIISAVWAVGMALGLLFLSKTPGYAVDLLSYLFGNILLVSRGDIWLMAALDLVILIVVFLLRKQFLAVCFDEEFSRLRGVPVAAVFLLLLCLVALTVVLLMQVVGIILVLALLTLPAAAAACFVRSLPALMLGATLAGLLCTSSGVVMSYATDLPAGSSIVFLAGVLYLAALVVRTYTERWRQSGRRRRRLQVVKDRLEAAAR